MSTKIAMKLINEKQTLEAQLEICLHALRLFYLEYDQTYDGEPLSHEYAEAIKLTEHILGHNRLQGKQKVL